MIKKTLNKLECSNVKPVNKIYARYHLNDCNFTDFTAPQCKEGAIRDAFIMGLDLPCIRQRLLEDNELLFSNVFNKARSLHEAQKC